METPTRSLRLADDEWAWLGERAKAAGESRNEVLRQILRAAMHPAPTTTEVPAVLDPEVDAAVARHPAGKRQRSHRPASGCVNTVTCGCTGWRPHHAGAMRCDCGCPMSAH